MSVRTAFLILTSITLMSWYPVVAIAQEADEREIVIAEQALPDSLKLVADEFGLQLAFFSEVAEGFEAPALNGSYTQDQALEALLAETMLEYGYIDNGTVVVRTKDQRGDSDSKNLSPATVLLAQNTGSPTQTMSSQKSEYEPSAEQTSSRIRTRDESVADAEASRENRGQIDYIVVVGSRNTGVRRFEDDAQPYVIFDSVDIEQSFAHNVEDLLRMRLPMNATQTPLSLDVGAASQSRGNQSSIDLRGLGTDQTLILINGRRLPNRTRGGFERAQPDINAIPLSAIERIEVLPSTASGIYGGGATGGVINLILKREYTGTDIVIGYDNTFETDAAKTSLEATGGFGLLGNRTSVLWSVAHSTQDELLTGDRDFARKARQLLVQNNPDAVFDQPFGPVGSTPNIGSLDGNPLVLDDGTPLNSNITYVPYGYGGPTADGGQALVQNAGQYNLDLPNDITGNKNALVNAPDVTSASLYLNHTLIEKIEILLDTSYLVNDGSFRRSFRAAAFILDGNAPNNPFQNRIYVSSPLPDPSIDVFSDSETTTLSIIAGAKFELPADWGMQLEYNYGESESSYENYVTLFARDLSIAASAGDLDVIRDYTAFPLNVDEFLFTEPTTVLFPAVNQLDVVSIRSSGGGFRMPGGQSQHALLLEYRDDKNESTFRKSTNFFRTTTFTYLPTSTQETLSIYAESLFPVFSAENARPGVQELELQLGLRHDSVDNTLPDLQTSIRLSDPTDPIPEIGTNKTAFDAFSYTLGLKYVPVDGIQLRASAATGFLPPSLDQLRLPTIGEREFPSFLHDLEDPKRGGRNDTNMLPITMVSGGNPNLEPEESEAISIGLILTPKSLDGFRLSVDYTRIEKADEIGSIATNNILALEDLLPGLVTRAPLTTEDEQLGYTGGQIVEIDTKLINIASTEVEAYDFQIDYAFDLGIGRVSFYTVATLQTRLASQIVPDAESIDRVGFVDGPLEWRASFGGVWETSSIALGWNAQYFDEYKITTSVSPDDFAANIIANQGASTIPSQTYHDLFAVFRLGDAWSSSSKFFDGLEVSFGIRNIFDEEPPIIATSNFRSGSYSTYGDPRLRRYSLQVRKSF